MKTGPKKAISIQTNELCSYGCNQIAKFKNHSGKLMCLKSPNSCPINKNKNSLAIKKKHAEMLLLNGKCGMYNYDDLPQETKDAMTPTKGLTFAKFVYGGGGNHKKELIVERGHVCESCLLSNWLNKPITLELEHIDSDRKNNIKENLKLLY